MNSGKLDVNQKIWVSTSITPEEAKAILDQAFHQRRFIQILGSCYVEYNGRARSILTEGERLIIIKSDGSLLVHKANGVEPVNWQPSGCTIKVKIKAGKLQITVNRDKPKEKVHIQFSNLLLLSISSPSDTGEFSMFLTELEMQRVLSANPDMIEPGLRVIRRERPVEPGFIDIYARDNKGRIVVVEIKRRRADREAVLQLQNYIKSLNIPKESQIRGILVAPSLTKGTQTLLEQLGLEYRKIEPQQCYQYLRSSKTRKLTDYLQEDEQDQPEK